MKTLKNQVFCRANRVEVVGTISFDPTVTAVMVNGQTLVEYALECIVAQEIMNMWRKLSKVLSTGTK